MKASVIAEKSIEFSVKTVLSCGKTHQTQMITILTVLVDIYQNEIEVPNPGETSFTQI
jgi:hypothetical protein